MEVINQNNQSTFHFSYLEEIVKNQQDINQQLTYSVQTMDQMFREAQNEQAQNFNHVKSKLDKNETVSNQVVATIKDQEIASAEILDKIQTMTVNFTKSKENEELINQAILDQLSFQDHTSNQMFHKLTEYEGMANELKAQLERYDELFNQVSDKLELQEVFHKTVLERMDQQDALSEKLMRQIEHIRSTLFERASVILEKIEDNFSKSKSFIQNLFPPNKQKYLIGRYENNEGVKKEAN